MCIVLFVCLAFDCQIVALIICICQTYFYVDYTPKFSSLDNWLGIFFNKIHYKLRVNTKY